jgi:hypothetical protein
MDFETSELAGAAEVCNWGSCMRSLLALTHLFLFSKFDQTMVHVHVDGPSRLVSEFPERNRVARISTLVIGERGVFDPNHRFVDWMIGAQFLLNLRLRRSCWFGGSRNFFFGRFR